MEQKVVWQLACMLYKLVLRDLLKKAIDDPKQEWDDYALEIADKVFNYS